MSLTNKLYVESECIDQCTTLNNAARLLGVSEDEVISIAAMGKINLVKNINNKIYFILPFELEAAMAFCKGTISIDKESFPIKSLKVWGYSLKAYGESIGIKIRLSNKVKFSPDFSSVIYEGKIYKLTGKLPVLFKYMYEEINNGTLSFRTGDLLRKININDAESLKNIFPKRCKPLFGTLFKKVEHGCWTLDL